jgi:hypothetical protein
MGNHQYNERHHSWAYDIRDSYVHISKAISGKKGYFCIGCKKEMIAVVNFKDPSHKQYFRHDVVNDHEAKCTYSDETTRHKIAKEILQQLKEIKVPATYSYPPLGTVGKPILLKKECFLKAHSIQIERTFFEDENGQIRWGSKADSEVPGRNYLIRPDVIFLNQEGQPILFIELVAKHKITEEKKVKIKRLGIDTVQVRLPVESQEEIERTFKIIERTKWVYNYEQESTKYVPVPKTLGETVSLVDEIQGELLEETYSCRTAETRNLLFAIKKCLGSESYRAVENDFRRELSRVEDNTESERERATGIQKAIDSQVELEFRGEMDRFRIEESSVAGQEEEFQQYCKDLEERYHKKREELDGEETAFRDRIKSEIGEEEFGSFDVQRRERELRNQTAAVERDIVKEEGAIGKIEIDIAELPETVEREETTYRAKVLGFEEREKRACDDIRNTMAELPKRFEGLRAELERRQQIEDTDDAQRIKDRDGNGVSELSGAIKGILDNWRLLNNYKNEFHIAKRFNQAYQCFKEGRYKAWNDFRRIHGMDGSK